MIVLLKLSRLCYMIGLVSFLILPLAASANSTSLKQDLTQAFRCSDVKDCKIDRSKRLVSEVVSLAGGSQRSYRELQNSQFDSQLACQRAIASASAAYVARRTDLVERGYRPETADQKASREMERIKRLCKVTVVDTGETSVPRVGKPCNIYLGAPGSIVDTYGLSKCFHETLNLYTDYLGY